MPNDKTELDIIEPFHIAMGHLILAQQSVVRANDQLVSLRTVVLDLVREMREMQDKIDQLKGGASCSPTAKT